jgi:hypothetical protein
MACNGWHEERLAVRSILPSRNLAVSLEFIRKKAQSAIEDPSNAVKFSAESSWEIAIKWALKRPDFTITLACSLPRSV